MSFLTSTTIGGCGPLTTCRICLVSGHPSNSESHAMQPFVGRTCDLLRELLKVAGIDSAEVFYTFVIQEPVKDPSKLISFKKTTTELSTAYITHESHLKSELSLCSANVFVPMDKIALYALCRQTSVDKYRGSILESTLLPGRKVIPILPPASAWSEYLFRHYILHDLVRIRKSSLEPELPTHDYILRTNPTFDEVLDYLDECSREPIIAFDIETSKQQLDCFSISHGSHFSMSIPLIAKSHPCWSLTQEAVILKRLADLLESPNTVKVLQNGIYDASFLFERYGIVINNVEDTMIAQGLLFPDFPKSLAFLASVYTTHPYYKDDGKLRFKGFATDDESFWRYSALDSLVTLEVWNRIKPDVISQALWDTYRSHIAIIQPLIELSFIGSPVDTSACARAIEQVDAKASFLRGELDTLCGMPINPASPKQLCEYFYGIKKIKPYLSGGRPTTDVTAMRRLSRRGFKEAKLILDIRHLQKFSSTYLKVKLDENNTLRCSANPIGTNTGRLSMSKAIFGFGCNRQNLPKRGELSLYPFLLQRSHYVPYGIDLSGAENRIVAYYGPVPPMIEAFERGLDVHRLTASLLFGTPYEEISDEPGSAGIMNSSKSQRDMGKMFNHSGNYGVGYKTLALKNDMPEDVVKIGLESYHNIYPEVRHNFQHQIRTQLERNNRTVTNCFGRTRKFMDRWGDDLFQDAYAFPAQSTIADIINRRGLAFIYDSQHLKEIHITNQIHDSIEFEISSHHPWLFHAKCITSIISSLSAPISWQSRSFSVPCDLEIRRHNYANSAKIKKPSANPRIFADQLASAYSRLRLVQNLA